MWDFNVHLKNVCDSFKTRPDENHVFHAFLCHFSDIYKENYLKIGFIHLNSCEQTKIIK